MANVSVVIPAYNHAEYIEQCIDSVLSQTYRDFEIIIVDDGSTDGTVNILRRYNDSIKIVCQHNQGTQAARNTGIKLSSGNFIAILDSDDKWMPEKLERQIEVFDSIPNVGLVYSQSLTIDPYDRILDKGKAFGDVPIGNELHFEQLLMGARIPTLTAIFKKECIENLGGFDESFIGAGDWDLWIRISLKYRVLGIEKPLAYYRKHPNNTTTKLETTHKGYFEWCKVLDKTFTNLPNDLKLYPGFEDKTYARAEMYGAYCSVIRHDIDGIAESFSRAFHLDKDLISNPTFVINVLTNFSHIYNEKKPSFREYRYFVNTVIDKLSDVFVGNKNVKKLVLTNSIIESIFINYNNKYYRGLLSLILLGFTRRPSIILNPGIWSILIGILFGEKVAVSLHRFHKFLRK